MKYMIRSAALFCIIAVASCKEKSKLAKELIQPSIIQLTARPSLPAARSGDADIIPAEILKRKEVPVICYHQIRNWRPTDSKTAKDYIVPVDNFRQQMKMLSDSGYRTVLPDQLYAYLVSGTPLPPRPVMLSFDDTDESQYEIAYRELNKYGFRAVYFIMTVSLGRPGYMSREQVRALSESGNVIGSHTWDHHNVKKYTTPDWGQQLDKPTKQLEEITGKKIEYFAYPFGLWNADAIPQLRRGGMKAAFQLSAKRDPQEPLYTIRRMIVPGSWSASVMHAWMKRSFN